MGLADNLRAYEKEGGDREEVIEKILKDRKGRPFGEDHPRNKFNARDRRKMRRHPKEYSEADLREAGVWGEVRAEYEEEEDEDEEDE
jgi:hypothetical protein